MFLGIMYSVAGGLGKEDTEKGACGAVNIKTSLPSAKEIVIQSLVGGGWYIHNERWKSESTDGICTVGLVCYRYVCI